MAQKLQPVTLRLTRQKFRRALAYTIEIVEQLGNAAEGSVADESKSEDELSDPGLGNGHPEEDSPGARRRVVQRPGRRPRRAYSAVGRRTYG